VPLLPSGGSKTPPISNLGSLLDSDRIKAIAAGFIWHVRQQIE